MNNPTPPGDETPPGNVPPGETPKPGSGETPPTTPSQLSIDDALKEIESYKAALAKANKEAKDHRLKANELDKLKAEIEASKLSETEKLQKQLADATKARDDALREKQDIQLSYAVTLQATKLNFADPDDGMRYINRADLNDDLSNVGDLLKQVLKDRPYLASKAAPPTSGGATNPPRSQTNRQELSWPLITAMKPEEYELRRVEIQQWMETHPAQFGQRLR